MGSLTVNGFDRDSLSFINLLKNWSSTPTTGDNYPADLNADGYPTQAPSTSISGTINPFPTNFTGQLVLKWTGTGTIQIERPVTVVSGAEFVSGGTGTRLIATGANGRIVFTIDSVPSSLTVIFPSGQTHTNMSGAVLCRVEDEAAHDAGDIFNPDFLEILQELNPSIIRTLGWSNPNENNNIGSDLYAWNASSFHYSNNRWHPNLWAGDASGTDTYTVGAAAVTPAEYTDREMIQCRFPNANTSTTVTLDIDGRGAKTVKTMFLANPAVGAIAANQLATFVYDAKTDFLLYRAGGITARTPVSVQVALANELGVDMWFNIPHLMDDASVTRMAQYIKANLNSSRTCYIELSNEIWNFGGGFPQTSYAYVVGKDFMGFTDADNRPYHGWYAKRYREVMEIFTDVWNGATAPRLQRVIAFQAFGIVASTNTYRMQGADLTLDSDATYWSGHNAKAFDASYSADDVNAVIPWADDYDSGDPASMADALDALDADIRGSSAADQTLKKLNDDIYPGWETIAAGYGKPVLAYEGGCEIAAPSESRLTALSIDTSNAAKIAALYAAYKEDNRFKVTASAQLRQFMLQPSSHTPSWFVAIGTSQWSLRQGDIYDEDTWKSWDACVARTSGTTVCSLKWAS
jgi:hypothetical protein